MRLLTNQTRRQKVEVQETAGYEQRAIINLLAAVAVCKVAVNPTQGVALNVNHSDSQTTQRPSQPVGIARRVAWFPTICSLVAFGTSFA